MKAISLLLLIPLLSAAQKSPPPCTNDPIYRQFDFWIGSWDVYGKNGKKAGDSKIEMILDSCVILENWKSANSNFTGKSFNSYNARTGQWQQNWVDNMGGSTEYGKGSFQNGTMIFYTSPFNFKKDTIAIRKLSFHFLEKNKVRQHAEITKDGEKTWITEYDLEYRRKE
jgi:hypothetical protein